MAFSVLKTEKHFLTKLSHPLCKDDSAFWVMKMVTEMSCQLWQYKVTHMKNKNTENIIHCGLHAAKQ